MKGKEWKDKRSEISPALTQLKLRATYPTIKNACSKLIKYIKENCENSKENGFLGKQLIDKYTLDIASIYMFGHDPHSFTDKENIFVEMGDAIADQTGPLYNRIFWGWGLSFLKYIWNVPLFTTKVVNFFIEMTNNAIKFREESQIEQNDFLQYLIELRKKKKGISEVELAANEGIIFINTFDTTSLLISNALYALAGDERVQSKLRDEIRNVIKEFGEINLNVLLDKMPYLDQVTNEVLRLYPSIPITTRNCTESIDISIEDNKTVRIEKGTMAIVPIWSVHHDPEYYPDPDKFYPERFDEELGGIKPFKDACVFMPFGAGPRICMGMKLADIMIKSAFVELLSNFKVSLNKKTIQPMELDRKEFFFVPKGGVWLNFNEL